MAHTKRLLPHICHFTEAIKLGHAVGELVAFVCFKYLGGSVVILVMKLGKFIGGAEQTDPPPFFGCSGVKF